MFLIRLILYLLTLLKEIYNAENSAQLWQLTDHGNLLRRIEPLVATLLSICISADKPLPFVHAES